MFDSKKCRNADTQHLCWLMSHGENPPYPERACRWSLDTNECLSTKRRSFFGWAEIPEHIRITKEWPKNYVDVISYDESRTSYDEAETSDDESETSDDESETSDDYNYVDSLDCESELTKYEDLKICRDMLERCRDGNCHAIKDNLKDTAQLKAIRFNNIDVIESCGVSSYNSSQDKIDTDEKFREKLFKNFGHMNHSSQDPQIIYTIKNVCEKIKIPGKYGDVISDYSNNCGIDSETVGIIQDVFNVKIKPLQLNQSPDAPLLEPYIDRSFEDYQTTWSMSKYITKMAEEFRDNKLEYNFKKMLIVSHSQFMKELSKQLGNQNIFNNLDILYVTKSKEGITNFKGVMRFPYYDLEPPVKNTQSTLSLYTPDVHHLFLMRHCIGCHNLLESNFTKVLSYKSGYTKYAMCIKKTEEELEMAIPYLKKSLRNILSDKRIDDFQFGSSPILRAIMTICIAQNIWNNHD